MAGRRGAGRRRARGLGAPLPGESWRRPGGKAPAPGEAGGNHPTRGRKTVHFSRRARQARARRANCDSNPLPRGAAQPGARSRRALPLAALGNLEPNRCPLRRVRPPRGAGHGLRRGLVSSPAIREGRWRERREERRWEQRESSRRAARRGGGGGGGGREEGRRRGEGGEGRPRRAAPRGAARSGGRGGRGGWGGGLGAREKVTPGRDRSDPRSEHRRRGCTRLPRPAAAGGGGRAGAGSPAPAPR